jgi:putative tricarboxylic transport membrane protein
LERKLAPGDLLVGLGVVALGLLVLWQTTEIPERLVTQMGPRVAPYVAGAALVALGAMLAFEGVRGGWRHTIEEEDAPLHYGSLAWLLGGLLVNVVLIGPLANLPLVGGLLEGVPNDGSFFGALVNSGLGFVPASSLQFVLIARAFGSTRIVRDLAIAIVVTVVSLVMFGRGFGVNIGGGLVDSWILQQFDRMLAALGFGG